MRVTMSIRSTDVSTGETTSKTYGNIAYQFIKQIGMGSDGSNPPTGEALPAEYTNFFQWCDAVGRGIISLTTDTYFNSSVAATFDVNEEIAN